MRRTMTGMLFSMNTSLKPRRARAVSRPSRPLLTIVGLISRLVSSIDNIFALGNESEIIKGAIEVEGFKAIVKDRQTLKKKKLVEATRQKQRLSDVN